MHQTNIAPSALPGRTNRQTVPSTRAPALRLGDDVAEDVVNEVREVRAAGGQRAHGQLLEAVVGVAPQQRAGRGRRQPVALVVGVGRGRAEAVVGQDVAGAIVGERAHRLRPAGAVSRRLLCALLNDVNAGFFIDKRKRLRTVKVIVSHANLKRQPI